MKKYYWVVSHTKDKKNQMCVVIVAPKTDDEADGPTMEDKIKNLLFRESDVGTVYYMEQTQENIYFSDLQYNLKTYDYSTL